MFHVASCARKPFLLYELLAATHFLRSGRDTYPDLQRLSEEQMELRLSNQLARLREAPRNGKGPLHFMHQIAKGYMIARDSKSVIQEGSSGRQLESGFALIFRYILKLFENFTSRALDLDAQKFVIRNFVYHASILDWSEGRHVANSFELTIVKLSEQLHYKILTKILDRFYERYPVRKRRTDTLDCIRQYNRIRLCLFYLLCYSPLSLQKSLTTYKAILKRERCYVLVAGCNFREMSSARLSTSFTDFDRRRCHCMRLRR